MIKLHLCNPLDRSKRLEVRFRLRDTPVARKYHACLKIAASQRYIYSPERFYSFPNSRFTERTIIDHLNSCIDRINAYAPGTIPIRAHESMPQEHLNELHTYFEKYRGPMLSPHPIYRDAPISVKNTFDEFNLSIHRYEDAGYSNRHAFGHRVPPKIHVTFGLNDVVKRYPFVDEDYTEFSFAHSFGDWHINYCEVGKPLHDVWRDRDANIGQEVILPLRYYSADALITFGRPVDRPTADRTEAEFYEWWDQNAAIMEGLGFRKHDPKNALGSIVVAELDREHLGDGRALSDDAVIERLSGYQFIDSVEA